MKYLLLSALLFLTACIGNPEPIVAPVEVLVNTQTVNLIPIQPKVDGINTTNIEWQILTYDILLDMFEEPDFNKKSFVVFALSVDDYEELSLTLVEVLRYIEQTNETILFYEISIGG